MSEITDLIAARKDAIARGDKALGREIYQHLQNLGISAIDIDTDSVPVDPDDVGVEAPEDEKPSRGKREKAVKPPAETRED